MENKLNLIELLDYIEPAMCSYEEWVNVGQALHEEGYECSAWDTWSAKDAQRYHTGECEKKWRTFGAYTGKHITGAVITNMAKENGWTPKGSSFKGTGMVFNFNTPITAGDDFRVVDVNYVDDEALDIPHNYEPARRVNDIITYLSTVFMPNEYVGYVVDVYETADGRKTPRKGNYMRTAGELIEELRRSGNIENTFGTTDPEAGAWIRFNPLDGQGVKNDNVTSYRYTLLESDAMSTGRQKAILEQLELPIVAMVYSGGKSVHAIVKVDAGSYPEYRDRVDFIYKIAQKNGFKVDSQNRNPSRLSRMPGIMRNGTPQFLVASNIGKETYEEWEEWINEANDNLGDADNLETEWNQMPDLAPELIEGVLREGHKMMIAGPSKAGKSFALIELTIALAEGLKWMSFQCHMGRVLYVNLEIDRASCLHRFKDVYKALNVEPRALRNIDIWNLRGKAVPMDVLARKLIRRFEKKNYKAIIIDPIYKVITGDENSAEQMSKFCGQFDRLATELHCAVIYCHHHSKGSQTQKRSMDRASGSGVFARDPDAMLDLIQLELKDEDMENQSSGTTAWRLEGTLREFPGFTPVNMWFKYPIHEVDETGMLQMAALDTPEERGLNTMNKNKKARKANKKERIVEAFNALSAFNGGEAVELDDVANYLNMSTRTLRRYIDESPIFDIKLGKLVKSEDVDN